MHFYKVGYYSWEQSPYGILIHQDRFTEEQLEEMVLSVMPDVIRQKDPADGTSIHAFQTAWEGVCEQLCGRYGFSKLEHTTDYVVFGWPDMFDMESWKVERQSDEKLNRLTRYLNDNGFSPDYGRLRAILDGKE